MACCCQRAPYVSIQRKAVISTAVQWNDRGCTGANARRLQWRFFVNGHLAYTTPIGLPTDPLAVGGGISIYALIAAGDEDLVSHLQSQGVAVQAGDTVQICLVAHNCQGESAGSNTLVFIAPNTAQTCDCGFAAEYHTGISGASAPLSAAFTGNYFAWLNGQLNQTGNSFAMPLDTLDELMFLRLSGCAATLDMQPVTGITGDVPIPGAFQPLPLADYLVFRNGLLQTGHSISGANLVPLVSWSDPTPLPSEPLDEWLFVRIAGSTTGCRFRAVRISPNGGHTGADVNLPPGYSSANQPDWALFRNGLAHYPVPSSIYGYTVDAAGLATPVLPFDGDDLWLIEII